MKKIYILLATTMILTACGTAQASKEERFTIRDDGLNITTDNQTGCKYIIYSWNGRGGLTPLLKSDGIPDCD